MENLQWPSKITQGSTSHKQLQTTRSTRYNTQVYCLSVRLITITQIYLDKREATAKHDHTGRIRNSSQHGRNQKKIIAKEDYQQQ